MINNNMIVRIEKRFIIINATELSPQNKKFAIGAKQTRESIANRIIWV